jgi:NAD(P)-dependent dehydrogenase (short-subunit alcohol dehydrogenase family)
MAIELAKRGAKVAVNYANAIEGAEAVVKEIKALGNGSDAAAFKANVGKVEETIKLMDDVVAHFGKLDICCSNSGVVSFGHFAEVEPEEFDRVFNINTRGQFFVAKEAYKRMEVGGRIILMGSITGQAKGVPKHAIYSGSKGAIETFTRCMAIGESTSLIFATNHALTRTQMLARRRLPSIALRPAVSRPTCTTLSAASTFPVARSSVTTRSTSTLKPGLLTTVSVSQWTLPASSASLPPRMVTGSTERSSASTVLLACKLLSSVNGFPCVPWAM